MSQSDSFAALRYGEFRALLAGSFLFSVALQIQEVALGYELYRITRQPLVLGLIGLAQALPFICTAMFGGYVADRNDRRRIALITLSFIAVGSAALWWIMEPARHDQLPQSTLLTIIYGVIALLGLARGFLTPSVTSLRAMLVPREIFPNAMAWSSSSFQAGSILGPVSAGFMLAWVGLSGTLALVTFLFIGGILLFAFFIRSRPVERSSVHTAPIWHSLREGLDFVWKNRIILHSITLDMMSVLFGGVVAILPVFAMDILHVGAEGLGLLRAASSCGAILTVLICTRHSPTGQPWRNLLIAVAGFSVSSLLFGLSTSFWLSMAMLFIAGACDSVSVVIRSTILQSMPPDHLRGRVLAVNSIFITTSNELGAFESGLAAQWLGAARSVVAGGVLSSLVVAVVWRRTRELLSVRL